MDPLNFSTDLTGTGERGIECIGRAQLTQMRALWPKRIDLAHSRKLFKNHLL